MLTTRGWRGTICIVASGRLARPPPLLRVWQGESVAAGLRPPHLTIDVAPHFGAQRMIRAHSSCELNEEPHGQGGNNEKHQSTHSRGRSPVTRGTSGLPVAPPDFRFGVGDDRNVTRHWSASWMLSDMLWRRLFHCHIMTSGGKTATPARTVQPDNDASGRRGLRYTPPKPRRWQRWLGWIRVAC
jgi:hypothetical protein